MLNAVLFILGVCVFALHSEIKRQQAVEDATIIKGHEDDVS